MTIERTIKGKTQYLMGDKIRYTGNSEILNGRLFYEAHWIEGHREGERCDVAECNIDSHISVILLQNESSLLKRMAPDDD